jgi:MFS family permease
MAHDVFISYTTEDEAIADAVCATLEAHRIGCWVARRDILPIKDWAEAIVGAISQSRLMVLVFSAHSNDSPYVRSEVEEAVNTGIPFASLVGRLGFGWLADYVVKRRLLAAAYVLQGAAIPIFATTDSPWQAVLFLVVFSAGWGGAIPVLPALEVEYFGLRAFGGIGGLLSGIATLGAFAGPVFAGVVSDVVDSYRPAFLLMTFTTMAAVPAILMMGRVPAWAREATSASMA